jgi:hypothetical protein
MSLTDSPCIKMELRNPTLTFTLVSCILPAIQKCRSGIVSKTADVVIGDAIQGIFEDSKWKTRNESKIKLIDLTNLDLASEVE